jgi:hypothetical protein
VVVGPEQKPSWRLLVPGLTSIFCVVLALMLLATHAFLTEDTWWHLALGEQTIRERHIPDVETFSFTVPGTPLASHSWLFDTVLAALERAGGLGLVEVLGFLLVAATLRTIASLARELGARPWLALAPVFFFVLSSAHFLVLRPQLVTYLAVVWQLLAWRRFLERGSREIYAAPLVLVLWSNFHGGFLIGIVFLCGFTFMEALDGWRRGDLGRAKRLALVTVTSLLAACVHPNGWHQFTDALANTPAGDAIHKMINEWQPPDPQVVPGAWFLVGAVALAVAITLALGERPPLVEVLLVLGTGGLALSAWRHVPIFGLVGAPILAAWPSRAKVTRMPGSLASVGAKLDTIFGAFDHRAGGLVLAALLALGLGVRELFSPSDVLAAPLVQKKFPVEAVRFARGKVHGRVFNKYEWGGFVTHELGEEKVFIDSRMVNFKPVLGDYLEISSGGAGALERLDFWKVDWTLTDSNDELARKLGVDARWKGVFDDGFACIYSRVR